MAPEPPSVGSLEASTARLADHHCLGRHHAVAVGLAPHADEAADLDRARLGLLALVADLGVLGQCHGLVAVRGLHREGGAVHTGNFAHDAPVAPEPPSVGSLAEDRERASGLVDPGLYVVGLLLGELTIFDGLIDLFLARLGHRRLQLGRGLTEQLGDSVDEPVIRRVRLGCAALGAGSANTHHRQRQGCHQPHSCHS